MPQVDGQVQPDLGMAGRLRNLASDFSGRQKSGSRGGCETTELKNGKPYFDAID